MDTLTDLETRRTQLITELNDPNLPEERMTAALEEAAEVRRQVEAYNDRVNRASEARTALEGVQPSQIRRPGAQERQQPEEQRIDMRTLGQRFVDSGIAQRYAARGGKGVSDGFTFEESLIDLETRALVSGGDGVYTGTSAGAFQRPPLQPWIATLNPDRVLRIVDVIDKNTTQNSSVDYVQDTSAAGFSGVAAETLEGNAKAEATATFAQKSAPVRTVAHFIPITRQALDDNPQLRGYVDGRLRYGLMRRLDNQILNGDGTGANLTGILNVSGIGTYAPGAAEARLLSLRKGRTIAELTELEPDVMVVNPSDWEKVDLLTAVGSGEFMAGPGGALVSTGLMGGVPGSAQLGAQYPAVAGRLAGTLWGMTVIPSTAIAAGTALIGNFSEAATLWDRQQTQVLIADQHASYFTSNILVLLAELRAALTVQQPKSFVKITFNGAA